MVFLSVAPPVSAAGSEDHQQELKHPAGGPQSQQRHNQTIGASVTKMASSQL